MTESVTRQDGLAGEALDSEVGSATAGIPAVALESEVGERVGGSNSVVESQPSKLLVAGSIPVSRSNLRSHGELRLASQRVGVAKVVRRSAEREGGPSLAIAD